MVSQVILVVKNLPASTGDRRDTGSIPGSGRSPREGNGNPLQYSCLENPMDGGVWRATVHGVTKSWTRLSAHTHAMLCSQNLSLLAQHVHYPKRKPCPSPFTSHHEPLSVANLSPWICLLWMFHMYGIIPCVFCDWLLSLRITCPCSTHIVACASTSSFYGCIPFHCAAVP